MAAKLTPMEYLRQQHGPLADAFQALRKATAEGPLDEATCELVALGSLATTGEMASFKVHARRARKIGVSADAMRQAIFVTFGATTTFSQVSAALHWIDDVFEAEA